MMTKDFTTLDTQKRIAKWSFLIALGVSALCYILGKTATGLGVVFSCVIMVLNFRALSLVPWVYQRIKIPPLAKAVTFAFYYLRFWVIVLVLFMVIPRAGYDFALGCFFGFVIPKLALGGLLLSDSGEEWWMQRNNPVETNLGPEKKLTPLEQELLNVNPFEFDIIEWELRNQLKKR